MTVFNWIIASPCRGVRSVEKEIYNDAGGDNDEEEFLVASHFESQNVHGIEQPETERKQRTCNGLAVFWPTMDLAEI